MIEWFYSFLGLLVVLGSLLLTFLAVYPFYKRIANGENWTTAFISDPERRKRRYKI